MDYAGLAGAFGADWVLRLRLVVLPECALTTPEAPGCQSRPLASTNNAAAKQVWADVEVSGGTVERGGLRSASELSGGTIVALTAGASGDAGDFGATQLQASSTWSAGGSSGDFSWSYPIRVPPSAGGPTPSIGLAYSSSSVDGRSEASNNQPSWLGEGFEYSPGFIERRYKPCAEDMSNSPNNTVKTGDMCWGTDNAVLSLNGRSTELIKDDASQVWRSKSEDGSTVERLTDTINGDNDNEYWKVTTADGTQYFFGRNRLTGWTAGKPETASTWTVPVAGNHVGEPCRQSGFVASFCAQAWRWNLDYIVDVHDNTMSLWYAAQTNKYARNLTDIDDVSYVRGGVLTRIDYGTDHRSGTDTVYTATNPPMRVVFDVADRCLTSCAIPANWPDTPKDLECAPSATECPGNYTPTFWSASRLSKVTTKVWDAGTVNYRDADSWTLTHTFPVPGDGTRAGLWLESIVHTGHIGGTPVSLPEINFDWVQMANRVDTLGDTKPAMNWMRMSEIWTETGGKISVRYTAPQCVPGTLMPSAPHTNTLRCFPMLSDDGSGGIETEYFHKYLVTSVTEADWTGGGTDVVTAYEYPGTPAWRHTDDVGLTKPAYRTWSEYRGYERVRVRTGAPGQETLTETTYLRGMHGGKDTPGGGARTVVYPALDLNADGDTTDAGDAAAVNDEDAFTGQSRAQTVYKGVDSDPVSATANRPWQSPPTATRVTGSSTVYARYTGVEDTYQATRLDAAPWWRVTRIHTEFDQYGMVDWATDHGDAAASNDETCTDKTYSRNTDLNLLALVGRVQTFALPCGQAPASTDDIIGDVRTSYDNNGYYDGQTGIPPTRGTPTQIETLRDWTVGGGTQWLVTSRSTFDLYGRASETWDVRNNKTTLTYTPTTGGPVTRLTTVDPLGTSYDDLEPAWGVPTGKVDINNKRTDLIYDQLGRLTKVWLANRSKTSFPTSPSIEYAYLIRNTGGVNAVTTRRLNAAASYLTSHALYDGLLRPRQTQTAAAAGGGTVLTETIYDAAGRVSIVNGNHHDPAVTPGTTLRTILEWQARTQTVAVYDRAGRVTDSIFKSAGAEKWRTVMAYGGDRTYLTPPSGGTPTTTIADAHGRTVALRQHSGGSVTGPYTTTQYTYNRKGRLTAMTDPVGNAWTYTFDVRGRQITADDPDKGQTTTAYNDFGDLVSTTDARGEVLAYEHDTLGRRIGVYDDTISTATKRATWVYDTLSGAKGRLASSSRWTTNGTVEYKIRVRGYNPLYLSSGEDYIIPAAETGLAGTYTFTRSYKVDGSPAGATFPNAGGLGGESLTYTYDATTGLPEQVTTNWPGAGTYVTNTNHTAFGEVGFIEYMQTAGNFLQRSFVYDDATRQLKQATTVRQITPQYLADVHYTYDAAGNVTKVADTPAGGAADTQCLTYDHLRRLTEAWTPSSGSCTAAPTLAGLGGPAKYWLTWTFDAVGSRRTETSHASGGDTVSTYNYPTAGSDRPHAVTSVVTTGPGAGTKSYTYDTAGNSRTRPAPAGGTQTLTWDSEGHLASATGSNSYLYTGDGARLIARDSTGKTLYLPNTEIRYTTSGGTVSATRYYTHAGSVCAMRQPGTGITWLVGDHQGTQQLAVASGPQTVTQRRQTPYGGVRGSNPTWPNPKGFVGGDKDATGLTHLGAREYDPAIGRFISVDPVQDLANPQQWHGYAYAENSPITLRDPTGLATNAHCLEECGSDDDGMYQQDAAESRANQRAQDARDRSRECRKFGECSGAPSIGATIIGGEGGKVFSLDFFSHWRYDKPFSMLEPWEQESVIAEAWCTNSPQACQALYFNPQDKLFYDIIGVGDAMDCSAGDAAGCAWTAGSIVTAGLGRLVKSGARIGEGIYDVGTKADNLPWEACRVAFNSFGGDTKVLMADGSRKRIDQIEVGDEVLATDPETGEHGPRTVTHVWVHQDELVTLTVVGGQVVTTEDHPFWNATDRQWQEARHLDPGDHLLGSTGTRHAVGRLLTGTSHTAAAYNLTVDDIHTYYVLAGDTPVLVHNDGGDSTVGTIFRSGPYAFQIYSNDHGPPHGHLKGNGYDIQLGQNGKPLDPNITLTKEQQKIVDDNLNTIRKSIGDRMAAYRINGC